MAHWRLCTRSHLASMMKICLAPHRSTRRRYARHRATRRGACPIPNHCASEHVVPKNPDESPRCRRFRSPASKHHQAAVRRPRRIIGHARHPCQWSGRPGSFAVRHDDLRSAVHVVHIDITFAVGRLPVFHQQLLELRLQCRIPQTADVFPIVRRCVHCPKTGLLLVIGLEDDPVSEEFQRLWNGCGRRCRAGQRRGCGR